MAGGKVKVFKILKSKSNSYFGDGALMRHWRVLPVTPRPKTKYAKTRILKPITGDVLRPLMGMSVNLTRRGANPLANRGRPQVGQQRPTGARPPMILDANYTACNPCTGD